MGYGRKKYRGETLTLPLLLEELPIRGAARIEFSLPSFRMQSASIEVNQSKAQ